MRAFRSYFVIIVLLERTTTETISCLSQQRTRPGNIKIVRIVGRLTGGPARQACLLHERLAGTFDTRLVMGSLSPGEHDMSDLLSSQSNVLKLEAMSREDPDCRMRLPSGGFIRFLRK